MLHCRFFMLLLIKLFSLALFYKKNPQQSSILCCASLEKGPILHLRVSFFNNLVLCIFSTFCSSSIHQIGNDRTPKMPEFREYSLLKCVELLTKRFCHWIKVFHILVMGFLAKVTHTLTPIVQHHNNRCSHQSDYKVWIEKNAFFNKT